MWIKDMNISLKHKNLYFPSPHQLLSFFILSRHHVCARADVQQGGNVGGIATALCHGDEGGPLTYEENGRFVTYCIKILLIFISCTIVHSFLFRRTLIGIFSFPDETFSMAQGRTCKPETPQVFTAVAPLVDWINENTKGKGSTPWRSNCQGHELGCVTYAHLQTLAGSG